MKKNQSNNYGIFLNILIIVYTLYISLSVFNPNSAIEKKEYFSILISNCVAVEKIKR